MHDNHPTAGTSSEGNSSMTNRLTKHAVHPALTRAIQGLTDNELAAIGQRLYEFRAVDATGPMYRILAGAYLTRHREIKTDTDLIAAIRSTGSG